MSEEQDDSQKTEEPTEKRLREAEEKGDVPHARDVGLLTAMVAAWLIVALAAPRSVSGVAASLLPFLENPNDFHLDGGAVDVLEGLRQVLVGVGVAMIPILAILAGSVVVSALGQGPLIVSAERIRPKLSNLSPMKGLKRIYSRQALVEFLKSLIKLVAIAFSAWIALYPYLDWTEAGVGLDVAALPELLRDLTLRLLLAVLLATVVMAVFDVLWNRFEWRKRLRMSFRELKDEYKQVEGDPHLKARVRELRRERSRKRMMANVPKATVVLTNPTHYAVALEYERGRTPAPICLAKGADLLALRIRQVAEENGVPIIENPPLARALYASAEIEEPIPIEHYQAVAEVMMYVLRLDRRAGRQV